MQNKFVTFLPYGSYRCAKLRVCNLGMLYLACGIAGLVDRKTNPSNCQDRPGAWCGTSNRDGLTEFEFALTTKTNQEPRLSNLTSPQPLTYRADSDRAHRQPSLVIWQARPERTEVNYSIPIRNLPTLLLPSSTVRQSSFKDSFARGHPLKIVKDNTGSNCWLL